MKKRLTLLALILFLVSSVYTEQQSATRKQTMAIVRLWNASPTDPKYIFVIGNGQFFEGYKTVDGLKEAISRLPEGSTVEWFPSDVIEGDEPLLAPEERMEFDKFCKSKGVTLIIHMAG